MAGVFLIAAIALSLGYLRRPPTSPRVTPFTSFLGQKSNPVFSPDGNQIAFIWSGGESAQRGAYVKLIGEGPPLRVASNPGLQLAWSPDGRSIAFDRVGNDGGIFTVPATGGSERRLSDGKSEDVLPSWSRDGRWIYFGSRRSGDWQIWRITSTGEQAEQVTRNGGFEAFEAADGKAVYYAKREPGIWRIPLAGGEETRILEQGMWGNWALLEQGICFLDHRAQPQPTLEFFNFATSQVRLFGNVERARAFGGSPGLAVSADGRWILYWQVDQIDNDIMLVENFR